jgi:membrane-bound lytic murein transglycosylase F
MKKFLLLILLFLLNHIEIKTSAISLNKKIEINQITMLIDLNYVMKKYNIFQVDSIMKSLSKPLNYVEKHNELNYDIIIKKQISPFDILIQKYAIKYNIDWFLYTSLLYQESRFKTNLVSKRGAWGLGQFMPATMKFLNINKNSTIEEQIEAGAKYLSYLNNMFKKHIPNKKERMKFVLASYNAGHGHIFDAQRIAVKFNKNPKIWYGHVENCLLKKSIPEIYTDNTIVKNGYFTGIETTKFVKEIIERQKKYQNLYN